MRHRLLNPASPKAAATFLPEAVIGWNGCEWERERGKADKVAEVTLKLLFKKNLYLVTLLI